MAAEIISLATMLTGVGGGVIIPFVNKLLGPSADELGITIAEHARIYRLKNAFNLFRKANEMAVKAGFEPQQVSMKTFLPLLEGASLEEENSIVDKWAALLANASNPTKKVDVKPVYADILRQLTPQEAQLLDNLFSNANYLNEITPFKRPDDYYYDIDSFHKLNATNQLLTLKHQLAKLGSHLWAKQALSALIDSLLRQRLLVPHKEHANMETTNSGHNSPEVTHVFFTSLGYDFMLACSPPKKAQKTST